MAKNITEEAQTSYEGKTRKINSIDTAQFEYTAEKMFTYGTLGVAVIAIYAAVIYMGVQQLKK